MYRNFTTFIYFHKIFHFIVSFRKNLYNPFVYKFSLYHIAQNIITLYIHVYNNMEDELPSAMEPRYNEVLGTMKITLLYQVSHNKKTKKYKELGPAKLPCYKRVLLYPTSL